MKKRYEPKSLQEIQYQIDKLLNNEKFKEKINQYGKEWEQLYKISTISSSEFCKKYRISPRWLAPIKFLFSLKILSPFTLKKGGETMTEEKRNQSVNTAQPQSVGSAQTTQPVSAEQIPHPVEKPVVIDKNTLVEAFIEAQQKLIELRKKQREEELKKQEEINQIKQEGKKELIQQLIDKCRLNPNAPECQGLNFNNEEQVLERIAQLVEKGRQSQIPVITPRLRGQVLREAILGNPKRVSEIIDELYEKNPEAIKQLFSYCAGGKCSVELTNILQKKAEEQKKPEEKQEIRKRLFRS